MEIPDEILLAKIKESCLYLDKKSIEKTTGIERAKYKLARAKLLEQYLFHVLNKKKGACKNKFTLTIKKNEWLSISSGDYLNKPCSYCDITKYALHGETSLLKKMKDRNNGFPFVATLPPNLYGELLKLCKIAKYEPTISKETQEIVGVPRDYMIDEKLRQLRLN